MTHRVGHFGVDLEDLDEVLQALARLDPYPDAAPALELLEAAGMPAVTLTNGGREHTEKCSSPQGYARASSRWLTVEEVRAYKPHPEPYQYAARTLGLPTESLTLIAAHGWDVLGARAAGLSAVWVDRLERRWPFPTVQPPSAGTLVEAVELARPSSRSPRRSCRGHRQAQPCPRATIAVVGRGSDRGLRHAVPAFPTRNEVWLRMLESPRKSARPWPQIIASGPSLDENGQLMLRTRYPSTSRR